jgi:hypothetical protein
LSSQDSDIPHPWTGKHRQDSVKKDCPYSFLKI